MLKVETPLLHHFRRRWSIDTITRKHGMTLLCNARKNGLCNFDCAERGAMEAHIHNENSKGDRTTSEILI